MVIKKHINNAPVSGGRNIVHLGEVCGWGGEGVEHKHPESHCCQVVARSSRPPPGAAATSLETLFAAAALVAQRQAAQAPRGQTTHLAMDTWLHW